MPGRTKTRNSISYANSAVRELIEAAREVVEASRRRDLDGPPTRTSVMP